ncbi:MAG: glycoside hydrolase family 88 protein [Saprospiraceae bacterium]|nr:glycoside hydrolase family 88 protein [Saprospiraceae bacterium]
MTTLKRTGILLLFLVSTALQGQESADWSVRMAATLMASHPDSFCYDKTKPARWDYELGLYLKSLEQLWRHTGDGAYFRYIRRQMDFYVRDDGSIRTYDSSAYNIDHITPGRVLLLLWQQTGQEKYRKAAQLLRRQLAAQPRTREGGFWHKKRYPWQMWLDGLYMGEPFYAEYSRLLEEPQNFDDIANQFIWMEAHARDSKTGLLYHAWDEHREQRWANTSTGQSPHFWGRAMGWYAMALVDVLDYFPREHPKYPQLLAIFQRLATAVASVQDPSTGVWYQVLDRPDQPGNYREASASCMFAYALLKGVRLGYLNPQFLPGAQKAFHGIVKEFMAQDAAGAWHLDKVCMVAGLGGEPYRDGSFQYYVSEPIRRDDLKGAAPFVLAALEMERLAAPRPGAGKTVLLDQFFNREFRNGKSFHYTWDDLKDSGYSWWGDIFARQGATLQALHSAPTAGNLAPAQVYIIVDPDTRKETESPHFMEKQHIKSIKKWVSEGGTLVLLANDSSNCETQQFNRLAGAFGIQFSGRSRNMVKNNQFEQGTVAVPEGHFLFKNSKTLYIKELSVLDIQAPAEVVLRAEGDVIMASARYGKGRVFALGDPWLYNEYVDGKKLPAGFDNFAAAGDLSAWLLYNPQTATAAEREQARVAEAVEAFRVALLDGKRDALEKIVADELSYGHSGGKVEDKAAFIDQLVSGRSDFTAIHLGHQTISVSGATAIVRHEFSAATNDAGKGPDTIRLAVLLVWTQQAGHWKLIARQAVKI